MIVWLVFFVLSSEKVDFYENVQIFKNLATNLPLAAISFGAMNK